MPTSTAATDHSRLARRAEPGDLDRNLQCRIRPQQRRRLQLHGKRLRRAIDREPFQADGPARHPFRRRIERPAQRRDQIGAGAPVGADRNFHLREARRNVHGLRREQTVADHIERQPSGGARRYRDRHGVARGIFRFVERDLEHVRRVGVGLDIVAGIERDRGDRTVRIGGRDFKPVTAEINRQRQARRFVGRRVRGSVGHALGGFDPLVIPAAAALIKLIMRVDAQQFVVQTALRERGSVGRDHDDVEGGGGAVAERSPENSGLTPIMLPAGATGSIDLVLDRAAAGLGHAHDDARFERMRARRQLVGLHREFGLALRVSRRQVFERLLCGFDLFVGDAELITGKARALFGDRDGDIACEIELGCGRAIEETPGDFDLCRRFLRDARGLRRQVELDPVRHVIFDQKARLADRRPFRIGEGTHVPGAGRRGGRQRHTRLWPPRPWSAISARRYSTPSGRSTTSVSGTSGAAAPCASRSSAVR